MRAYDPSLPLIFIHVPKTAGSAVQQVFRSWFGTRLKLNYFKEREGRMPERLDLVSGEQNLAIYGHFNRLRGFGIEDYYPEVNQFVTILRDPFEMAVSNYFYLNRVGDGWQQPPELLGQSLENALLNQPLNMLNHFPSAVTGENYRSMIDSNFIAVGVTEHLAESLAWIGEKLGFPFDEAELSVVNATERDQPVPESLRDRFREVHALECEVYDYALARFREERDGAGRFTG